MSERSPLLSSDSTAELEPDHRHQSPNEADQDAARPALSFLRGVIVAVSIIVQLFILLFGVSALTTIQSSIANDLGVTDGASWFVSTYLLASTSIMPIAGKICQIFSPRSYLLVSSIILSVGLLLTGFAPSFNSFIAGRIVCGIGAAASTPVSFVLVTELLAEKRWGLAFGLLNAAYTVGVALGAVVGGAVEPVIGWRAMFYIQAPVSLVSGIASFFSLPAKSCSKTLDRDSDLAWTQRLAMIDYFGIITLVAAVVLALFTLASATTNIAPILLSIVLLVLFYQIESRWAVEPVIPPAVLHSKATILTGIATVGFLCARWEIILYVPPYGMAVREWTQAESGLLLVPTNVGFAIGSLMVGLLHIRQARSYYLPCLVCFGVFIVDHFAVSRMMTPDSPVWLFVTLLFISGFLGGALLNYNLTHLLYLTEPIHHPIILPVNATFRSLSGSIGSSLTGGLFVRLLRGSLAQGFAAHGLYGKDELISQLLSRPMLVQSLHGIEHEVAQASYVSTLRSIFVVGCLWVIVMLVLQAGTGWTAPQVKVSEPDGNDSTAAKDHAGEESAPPGTNV